MDLNDRLSKIQLVVFDIDGTLTDGVMYYTAEGDVMKRFYVQDGMGITLLQRAGIQVAFMTSENSPIVAARAKKLGIAHAILGTRAKKQDLTALTERLGISLEAVAYMGDDVNDAAPMRIAGVSACPADAVEEIKSVSQYVCKRSGGCGAAREFIEMILRSQSKATTLPDAW